jgi:hypothetical protein
LTIDMKDLKQTARVRIAIPDPAKRAPVRGELLGSRTASSGSASPASPSGRNSLRRVNPAG